MALWLDCWYVSMVLFVPVGLVAAYDWLIAVIAVVTNVSIVLSIELTKAPALSLTSGGYKASLAVHAVYRAVNG